MKPISRNLKLRKANVSNVPLKQPPCHLRCLLTLFLSIGIHVPVRVEPKVYFAAERTFLSWLEFSIILGSIAAALLNLGKDTIALASSWAFTILACLALLYSLVLYMFRVEKIRKRRDVRRIYHEKWGPSILCAGLVVAFMVNAGLRLRGGNIDGDPARGGLPGHVPEHGGRHGGEL